MIKRIQHLFRSRVVERRLESELRFHLEQQVAEHVERGATPEEAHRRARLELGGVEQVKQQCRDVYWENHLANVFADFRFAIRSVGKDRRFTSLAILSLALGIGATTLIFSMIDCVLLHPFPYKKADRLASLSVLSAHRSLQRLPVQAFLDFKQQSHVFEDMFGLSFTEMHYTRGEDTETFFGGWVTPNTFDVLGIRPFMGRPISQEDGKPAAAPVFAMSYQLWSKLFHGDPKILGTTITLNGMPMTLVAIMPPRFHFGDCDVWIPLNITRTTVIPGTGSEPAEIWIVGHLKSGISQQTAAANLRPIAQRLEKSFPAYFPTQSQLVVSSFTNNFVGHFQGTLFALMAAVTMLLLIACSNVANLLLARATVREREIVIRASLGASRARLIQQLLVESLFLAILSCIAGCIIAYFGLRLVVHMIPPGTIPSEVAIALNLPTLLFAIGVAIVTILLCGLAPAIHFVRGELQAGLKRSGKSNNAGLRNGRFRSSLAILEVALSIVLLVGAGLMMRSFLKLKQVDLGFNPSNVLYARLSLPEGRYDTAAQKEVFFQKVLDRIKTLPGVIAATEATSFPPYSWGWTRLIVMGRTPTKSWGTAFDMCSEGYFKTLQRHLLRGRLLSRGDVNAARKVVVVNQTFAHDYFGSADPVGKEIQFSSFEIYPDWPHNAYFEIVGVIGDAKNHGLQDPSRPEAYFPYTITGIGSRGIMVRTALNSEFTLGAIRRQISAVDPEVAMAESGSIETSLKESYYAVPQFRLAMLGVFAGVGLVLVIIGVFSVMAYTVSLRTYEIGIRLALGAQQSEILNMVLKKALYLLAIGTLLGVMASLWLTRFIANQVWGISVVDPWTYASVVACVVVVGLVASFVPARRAAQIDPLITLRSE